MKITELIVTAGGGRAWTAVAVLGVVALLLGLAAPGGASEPAVVLVFRSHIMPERIEVDVGHMVTWRAAEGGMVRLEMDPHPAGHEVVVRAGQIHASFREPGIHGFTVTLRGRETDSLRGAVVVRPKEAPEDELPVCGLESSGRICVEP